MTKFDPLKISRDLDLCAPYFKQLVEKAIADCNALGYQVRVFEAFRTEERQDWLYAQGRTREGKIVTKARGGWSWHNYGLAQDVAQLINGVWSWDFDPAKIAQPFLDQGLEWLYPFESCHFQMTGGIPIKKARETAQKFGLPKLWADVENGKK